MSGDSSLDRQVKKSEAILQNSKADPWRMPLARLLRAMTIASMLSCIAISLVQYVDLLYPDFPANFAVLIVSLVSLESIQAYHLLKQHEVKSEDRLRFRVVEWATILLVVRFGPYLYLGFGRLAADARLWSEDVGTFLSLSFVVSATLVALFWGAAYVLTRDIEGLQATPWERKRSARDPEYYLQSTMPQHGQVNRQAILDRIISLFFIGGAVLLLFAGMARVDVTELVLLQASRSSGVILNALAYFVLGFLLISQAQYTVNRARWRIEGVPILDAVGRRWLVMVVVFLGLLAVIAAFLPVSYSVGVIDLLSLILRWALYVIVQVAFLIVFLFSVVTGLIGRLINLSPEAPSPTLERLPPPPPVDPVVEAGGWAWWGLVRSALFWGVLTALMLYSVLHFAQDRWGILAGFSLRAWLAKFADLWQSFRGSSGYLVGRMVEAVRQRLAGVGHGRTPRPWGYVSLRRLSPRDRVRYFYLSLLHRGAQLGFERPVSATPLEYRDRLRREMPESTDDIDTLTDAFNQARYSAEDVSVERARGVQQVWRSIKHALTRRRRALRNREESES